MKTEQNYDFRRELLTVHEADRRNPARTPQPNEYWLEQGAKIAIAPDAPEVIAVAAADFCDYLSVTMGVKASLVTQGKGNLSVALASTLGVDLGSLPPIRAFVSWWMPRASPSLPTMTEARRRRSIISRI